MADPKLVRSSIEIKYAADDGYRAEYGGKSGQGSKNLRTGEEVPPQHALIAGLEELARLTALFGFEAEALEAFNGARQRVAEWKAQRAQKTIPSQGIDP